MKREREILLVRGVVNFKPALRGFRERGFKVRVMDFDLAEVGKISREVPSIIVVLYFNDSVFELARVTDGPIIVWLADKVIIKRANNLGLDLTRLFVFSFDPKDLEAFKGAGINNSWYLPCSSGFEFSKLEERHREQVKESLYDVSFVGESITVKHNPYFQLLLNYSKMIEHINTVVEEQVSGFTENTLIETFERGYTGQFSIQYMVDFLALIERRELDFIIGCEASSRLRKKLLSNLHGFDLHIFGDPFWSATETDSIKIHEEVSYPVETAAIYRESRININISRVFFSGVIQRVYDIIFCGGFCLTDYRADLANCFEPDREIVFYSSPGELKEKISYYLKNPEERERIAVAGRKRLLKEHRATHRIGFILGKLKERVKKHGPRSRNSR